MYIAADLEMNHDKIFGGLWPGKIRTGMISYRRRLESWNFGYSNCSYYIIHEANNKGADQTAHMRKLFCILVVCSGDKQDFSWSCSIV